MVDPATARQQQYLQNLGTRPGYSEWLETLSPEKRARVQRSVGAYKHGLQAAAPLTCKGPSRCPFYDACPIPPRPGVVLPEGEYPIGLVCVLEGEYVNQRIADYLVHLDVDPANPVELSIVQELGLIDLYKNRALLVLSHGDTTNQGRDFMHVDESITGMTDGGNPLVSKTTKIHPVLEFIDRLEKRREKWLDRLMETRKAKADWAYKLGQGQDTKMLDEIQQIKNFLTQLGAQPLQLPEHEEPIGLDELLELEHELKDPS